MTTNLKILLTDHEPIWATAALIALKKIDYIQIVGAETDSHDLVDIVLHFGHYAEITHRIFGTARLGFWYFCFGGHNTEPTTAAKKTAAVHAALETSLWTIMPNGDKICLYQSFGQLTPFTLNRNLSRALHKTAYFPLRIIKNYQRTGQLISCMPEPISMSNSLFISTFSEWFAIARKIFYRLLYNEQWFIIAGIGDELVPDPVTAKWLINPPDTEFWADPFPIEHDGRVWLLFEALPFDTQCGYLAAIELFKDGSHSDPVTIMNTGSHLSYPFIFKWEGELYMIPEAGASKEVTLWKNEEFPAMWSKVSTLLTDICYSDATLTHHNNLFWLFLTIKQENACLNDELHVYFASTPLGPWSPHVNNPVKSDARNARPAGNIFVQNETLYRPAQDCSTIYGKAVVLNRIDTLTTDFFAETPIDRIDASWGDSQRCHSLTRSEHYWAIDGLRFVSRWRIV